MTLETAENFMADPVTESQVRQVLLDDAARGEFVILSQGPERYIQASGEGDGPYTLEYRDGDADHHFDGGHTHIKADVERAFLWYLAGDPRWKTDFAWQKWVAKPWWKIW